MDKWSFHDMGLFSNAHCNSFNVGKGNATTFSWVCASGVESREQSSSSVFSLIISGSGFSTSLYTILHFLKNRVRTKENLRFHCVFIK